MKWRQQEHKGPAGQKSLGFHTHRVTEAEDPRTAEAEARSIFRMRMPLAGSKSRVGHCSTQSFQAGDIISFLSQPHRLVLQFYFERPQSHKWSGVPKGPVSAPGPGKIPTRRTEPLCETLLFCQMPMERKL